MYPGVPALAGFMQRNTCYTGLRIALDAAVLVVLMLIRFAQISYAIVVGCLVYVV